MSINIVLPNGGENWFLGAKQNITWRSSGILGNVKLELLQNGIKIGDIAQNIQVVSGSYLWKVGDYQGGAASIGSGYKIRIKTMDGEHEDESDESFSIVFFILLASIQVTSPSKSQTWHPGNSYSIQWKTWGQMDSHVEIIDYATGFPKPPSPGARVHVITNSTPNNGLYKWSIPSLHRTGSYVVRVKTVDNKVWGDSEILMIKSKYPSKARPHRAPPAPDFPVGMKTFCLELYSLIDKYRNSKGLDSLLLDKCLCKAAQNHSDWMKSKGFYYFYDDKSKKFKNDPHEGTFTPPSSDCPATSYYSDAENVHFVRQKVAQKVFNDWKNSPGHNTNMLGDHTKIGIGVSFGKSENEDFYYVTAQFY